MNAATHQHQTGTKPKHKQTKRQRQKWLLMGFGVGVAGIAALIGYPTSLFISDAGEVYATHTGMLTPQQLDGYIATGLAQMKSKSA